MNIGISVICSTNKINMFENILKNYISQNYELKELIIIINYDISNLNDLIKLIPVNENIQLYILGSKKSLGECLNYAVEKSKYPVIAKYDDDDYYSPCYLKDTVKSLSLENVGIVGKSCTYLYFTEENILAIQNISNENKYVRRVAGGTLMFKRVLFENIKFRNINLGEDIKFCEDCLGIGYKIFSTNRYNYVYIRNKNWWNQIPRNYKVIGLKLHPTWQNYHLIEHLDEILKIAKDNNWAIITHSGVNEPYVDIEKSISIADKYPEVPVIFAHLGNGFSSYKDVLTQIECLSKTNNQNTLIDTSSLAIHLNGLLEESINKIGSHRILFGTDIPLHFPQTMLARIIEAKISTEDKEKILYYNAISFFPKLKGV